MKFSAEAEGQDREQLEAVPGPSWLSPGRRCPCHIVTEGVLLVSAQHPKDEYFSVFLHQGLGAGI